MTEGYDAVIVGGGPNGLAAAVALSREGASVLLIEAQPTVGGGCRTLELTLPGFRHDACAAIHPAAAGSPFLGQLPLRDHGLAWIHPDIPVAHPLDDGSAALLHRSLDETVTGLREDGAAYRKIMAPIAENWWKFADDALGPLKFPRSPLFMAAFARRGLRSAKHLQKAFSGKYAKAIVAGLAAHGMLPLDRPLTAAFAISLGAAGHAVGWPMAAGGSQAITNALESYFLTLGGGVETEREVRSLRDIPDTKTVLFDTSPKQLLQITEDRFPKAYRRKLSAFRLGPGVFKVDYALDGAVPWTAEECRRAGTVHVGGTFDEIAGSESQVASGEHPERPFVLVAQQSLFDPDRAPEGKHTLWAYCHVPNGSDVDMQEAITAQIERFAPGFRDRILTSVANSSADYERYNLNFHGGDISGGAHDGLQFFARPVLRAKPYKTPVRGVFLCSSSTPPGAGVHGMCGFQAARLALQEIHR